MIIKTMAKKITAESVHNATNNVLNHLIVNPLEIFIATLLAIIAVIK
jgi:hypothetical protein